jgi:hypothetical protein
MLESRITGTYRYHGSDDQSLGGRFSGFPEVLSGVVVENCCALVRYGRQIEPCPKRTNIEIREVIDTNTSKVVLRRSLHGGV